MMMMTTVMTMMTEITVDNSDELTLIIGMGDGWLKIG